MKKFLLLICLSVTLMLNAQIAHAQSNAMNFDGADDKVSIASTGQFNFPGGNFTIQTKYKSTSASSIIFDFINSDGTCAIAMGIANGRLTVFTTSASSGGAVTSVNNGKWHDIAFVKAGSICSIYLDGIVAQTISVSVVFTSVSALNLGLKTSTLFGFYNAASTLDHFKLFNYAKTLPVIQAEMNQENPSTTGLVAFYNFNQGIPNGNNTAITQLTDNSGNNNTGVLSGLALTGTTSNFVGGYLYPPGNALHFDGSDDYVEFGTKPVNLNSGTAFTIETWIRTSLPNSAIFAYTNGNTTWENGEKILATDLTGAIYFDGFNIGHVGTDISVSDGKWHHVAVATDGTGTGLKIYIDGVDHTSGSPAYAGGAADIGLPRLGFSPISGTANFTGNIDQFRIWNVNRSAAQILDGMQNGFPTVTTGLVGSYGFDEGIANATNTGITNLPDLTASNNGTLNNFALTGTTSNWVGSYVLTIPTATAATVSNSSFTANWTAPAIGTADSYRLDVATDAAFSNILTGYNNLTVNGLSAVVNNVKPGTAYYYRVRAFSSTLGEGVSSNVITATTTALTPPGNALQFNKTNDRVSVPTTSGKFHFGTGDFSVETWINTTQSNVDVISDSGPGHGFALGVAAGYMSFSISGAGFFMYDMPLINDGKWHHIAASIISGTLYAYVDGVASFARAMSRDATPNVNLTIGNQFVKMDEVKIYNIGLPYANVLYDMRNTAASVPGNLVAYYNFDQGTPGANNAGIITLYDQSANALNGTLNNFTLNGSTSNWVSSYATVVPVLTTGTATNSAITANWTAPINGVVGTYSLDYSTSSTFAAAVKTIDNIPSNALSQVINDLKPGTTYFYRIRAVNGVDIGANSNVLSSITTALAFPGNGLDFDGADDYVAIPATNLPTGNSSYTLEAWVNPADILANPNRGIIGYGNYGTTNQVNALRFDVVGSQVRIQNYWWANDINVNIPNISGKWSHVAATFNSSTGLRSIYLDGQLMGSDTPDVTGHAVTSNNFRLGSTNGGEFFMGKMDEVRVYNTARTQAQILSDLKTTTPATTGLVAAYNFDSGLANQPNPGIVTLYDQGGSGNNGTLTNFALTAASSNWTSSYAGIVPTTITATPIANTSFTAKWLAPSTGVTNKYYLDVSLDPAFGNSLPGYTNLDVATVTSYSVTGLLANTTYYYRVRSYNTALAVQGGNSNVTSVLTLKTDQTITMAATASKTYGDVDFNVNATSSNSSGTPAITYTTSNASIATVDAAGLVHILTKGTVTITARQAVDATYNAAADKTQVINIAAKPLTITATAGQSKVYGSTDPPLLYTNTPLVSGDSFTGSLTRVAGENVLGYPIGIGNLTAGPNYNISLISSNFNITPKPVTVTAIAGQSKVYGSTDPVFTYSYTPLAFADTFNGALGRTAGENVGNTYAITIGNLSLNTNYTLTYSSNTFSIIPKPVTVTANAGQSKVYGALDPAFTYSYTPLAFADTFIGALSRVAGEKAQVIMELL